MRAARILRIALLDAAVLFALLAFAPGAGAAAAAVDRNQGAVDILIQKLASSDCATRWEALRNFLGSTEERLPRLRALRQRVKTVDKPMQQRLLSLVEYLEQGRMARAKTDALTRETEGIVKGWDDRRRAARLDRLRQRLLHIINDPKELFSARTFAASYMAVLVHKFGAELPREWSGEFPKLLESEDPQVRLAGSFVAAGVGFPEVQGPEKGVVIPILIAGLRGASFAERSPSQGTLLRVTGANLGEFCLDPTDPPEVRAAGIRRWEQWWAQSKDRLARDKILPDRK